MEPNTFDKLKSMFDTYYDGRIGLWYASVPNLPGTETGKTEHEAITNMVEYLIKYSINASTRPFQPADGDNEVRHPAR